MNNALPGNPRYQPKDLIPFAGYDHIAGYYVEVELAAMATLAEMGIIPSEHYALLTPEVKGRLLAITTSDVDHVERALTKHDIRALVRIMQERLPEPLRKYVHVPLTSYDVIDTARALMLSRMHAVVRKKVRALIGAIADLARTHAGTVQIGRTHGQHALPITVGFWLATILGRILSNAEEMERHAKGLVGKISGAVGTYNAQTALGIYEHTGKRFENRVLERLGLQPASISTQIVPPEPVARYLFSALLMSSALAQLGQDARQLMRTEIREVAEPLTKGQVGSSTMAHKRNPANFEQLCGMETNNIAEFMRVLLTLTSEHQRDLTGSAPARDFPAIIVFLVQQLDTLTRADKDGKPFIGRITIDKEALARNFARSGDTILAEPLYLTLQLHGYEGDAHDLINHTLLPMIGREATSLMHALELHAEHDDNVARVLQTIPPDVFDSMSDPARYIGKAVEKTLQMCTQADEYLE